MVRNAEAILKHQVHGPKTENVKDVSKVYLLLTVLNGGTGLEG